MITFFTLPPRCFDAFSRSAKTRSSLPSTTTAVSVKSTSPGKRPRIESYLRRCASVLVSVMSFTPTQSMSAPAALAAARTADADREVGLALSHVGRQEVVEQRDQVLVEVADAVAVLDVVDHR